MKDKNEKFIFFDINCNLKDIEKSVQIARESIERKLSKKDLSDEHEVSVKLRVYYD